MKSTITIMQASTLRSCVLTSSPLASPRSHMLGPGKSTSAGPLVSASVAHTPHLGSYGNLQFPPSLYSGFPKPPYSRLHTRLRRQRQVCHPPAHTLQRSSADHQIHPSPWPPKFISISLSHMLYTSGLRIPTYS